MAELNKQKTKWQNILTLALSVLGILFFFGQAFILGLTWLISFFDPQTGLPEGISIGLWVWSAILSGLILLPILLLSIYRLRAQPIPPWLDAGRPAVRKTVLWLILLWPLVVFLGWFVAGRPSIAVFLLGPINLLVAGLPVIWIYTTAQWQLDGGSQMRKWRLFGFSLTVTPVVIIIAEVLAIIILAGIGFLWLTIRTATDPQLEREIMHIINRVMIAGDDIETLLRYLEPYILQPVVVFVVLAVLGGVMPIIEELLKPLALFALAGRKLSPQEGFVGGLLCGAGFALIENILYFTTSLVVEDWLFMAVGRAGTGVLHMLASGIVGWGLAKAWRDGKWLFFAATTFFAILIHSIWNSIAVLSGIAPLYLVGPDLTTWQIILYNSPMIFLLVLAALALFLINRFLRRQSTSS